ncbi:OmpA family protein [Mucilaginibacter achroorhodeus]|uniref:OmpA family protein n=1 Tax=Mucilaginibacter achroorhodeus TaxID=2599294 RepID=A0A563TZ10_9SPHI|nr:OmpA family protein [Mucilaginibacter achroorhodeus]TWR24605.1 OmpA family protein [Mucilaginibacter achroorhodeus]
MKFLKAIYLPLLIAASVAILPACKSKKPLVQTPPPPKAAPAPAPTPPPPPPPAPAPAPAPPDYNFKNIQFEFNSGILKTTAYPILDKAVAEMKKDASVNFQLNGNSSAEGSEQHNMDLSVERANSVKTYLVNSGIDASRLIVKGFGESKPLNGNKTEEERAVNRRVEIQKL